MVATSNINISISKNIEAISVVFVLALLRFAHYAPQNKTCLKMKAVLVVTKK